MKAIDNKKDLDKIIKTARIIWCFTIVLAIVFLALGINSLVTAGPFLENEEAALLPHGAAIALTIIGAIFAMATVFLTFFSFVVPLMTKLAPKIGGVMIDANKDNIQTVMRTITDANNTQSDATATDNASPSTAEPDGETMYCHSCGQKISKDSAYCKHCGAKQ